ncbi:LOW QUALITY PROTEIN: uncharacterized protein C17orf47 homolog [Echinops telfairi]|uniref:LOW QUALITY PROTEIN: uncharacterized protein C17orf47 homolog n=1 Tax=Echinops telfairi TaxID=9371 RepID=A0ABM0ITP4_ECHTE|nr:LOW QUALITY PROTEIN: uncharacterized protein C17orf47 homolog [Echinops telfairi]
MGSSQRGTVYHLVKTNKTGSKVAVATHKGAEVSSAAPHRGHGSSVTSHHRSIANSLTSPPSRKSEAGQHTTTDYARSFSPPSGPSVRASVPRGIESQSRTRSEASRQSSSPQKGQRTQSISHNVTLHRSVNAPREEATLRAAGHESSQRSWLPTDDRANRRLSFVDEKDTLEGLQEEERPSKVQNPQGVRVPRRVSLYPKDEAVQTDLPRRIAPTDARPPEHGSSRASVEPRAAQRRTPGPEIDVDAQTACYSAAKALQKNAKMESSLKLSMLRESGAGHRRRTEVEPTLKNANAIYTEPKATTKLTLSSEVESNPKPAAREGELSRRVTISKAPQRLVARPVALESSGRSSTFLTPEPICKPHTQRTPETVHTAAAPSRKPCVHMELGLTPRPLPPRSLPRYGPDSSWWPLLNPDFEMPSSRPVTPDFEPLSPAPLESLLSFFEKDSSPFTEDVLFSREVASPPQPPAPEASPSPPPPSPPPVAATKRSSAGLPLRDELQAPKRTAPQPIQSFSAFFLDVSEEMYNRVIWWLKGLCSSLSWVRCGSLARAGRGGGRFCVYRVC